MPYASSVSSGNSFASVVIGRVIVICGICISRESARRMISRPSNVPPCMCIVR